ncbi:MAG: hypothetical protein R8J84_00215, partial [Mariprofundales bacterium]
MIIKRSLLLAVAMMFGLGFGTASAWAHGHDMNPCNPCAMKHDMNPCNPCAMKTTKGQWGTPGNKTLRKHTFDNFQQAASLGAKMWKDES